MRVGRLRTADGWAETDVEAEMAKSRAVKVLLENMFAVSVEWMFVRVRFRESRKLEGEVEISLWSVLC